MLEPRLYVSDTESLTEVKGHKKSYHATSYKNILVSPGFGIRALAILRPQ